PAARKAEPIGAWSQYDARMRLAWARARPLAVFLLVVLAASSAACRGGARAGTGGSSGGGGGPGGADAGGPVDSSSPRDATDGATALSADEACRMAIDIQCQ